MQTFSHDYTKPKEVEDLLYRTTRLMANECYAAAVERINEARQILQDYLAHDNMIPDNDVAYGWVKAHDVEELTKGREDKEDPWNKEWLLKKLIVIQLHVNGMSLSEIAANTGAATQTVKDIISRFEEDT